MILPTKLYEALRWVIAIVIPAFSVLLATLASAWNWNIPIDAILVSIDAVALFLGTIFGISKLSNDKKVKGAIKLDPEQGV